MFNNQNAANSPYGAYELKATYQRNMIVSSLTVNGLITITLLIVIALVNSQDIKHVPVAPTWISEEIVPPPTITSELPQVNVNPPQQQLPAVEQLPPLDDDALIEDDAQIIENNDVFPEISGTDRSQTTNTNIGPVTSQYDGIMPGITQFVAVEQIPEFVYKAKPEYPRFERMAGIEGTVWIAVEVDVDGSVTDAKIYKTSGRVSLDQAALAVAFKNKFRPAIQNNNPIKLWVAYEVEFVLN